MKPDSVRIEVDRILRKYTCSNCGEKTARMDAEKPDADPIACWKCSAELGLTVGEFRADVQALGHRQIQEILRSSAIKAVDRAGDA